MQYNDTVTPLRHRIKRKGGANWFGQVEDPATRSFDGQEWQSTKCSVKRDADAVARRWAADRLEAYRSPASAGPVATLHGALVALEQAMITAWSPESHEIFGLKSRHLVAHFGEDFNLYEITQDATTKYLNKRVLEHGVSQATVAKELSYLVRVARRCKAIYSAADIWPEALPTEFPGVDRCLSTDEFTALLDELGPVTSYERAQPHGTGFSERRQQTIEHADPLGQDWRDHFVTYTLAGPRFSELYEIYPHHVTGDFVIINGNKTEKARRRVPLQPDVRVVVERRAELAGDGPLFTIETKTQKTGDKAPLENQKRNWLHALAKACVRAGVPHCTTNDLRRTFATWCRDAGVEEATCVGWMGHADSKMIRKVYGQATLERQRLEVAKLPTFADGKADRTITPLANLRLVRTK